jgi:hypothetical protein
VLLDANVPAWRFQLHGQASVVDGWRHELGHAIGRRVHWSRLTATPWGGLVEVELWQTRDGEAARVREAHVLHVDDDRIVEHVLWCTGPADAQAVAAEAAEAPLVRA